MSRYMPLSFTLASLIALASTSDAFATVLSALGFFLQHWRPTIVRGR